MKQDDSQNEHKEFMQFMHRVMAEIPRPAKPDVDEPGEPHTPETKITEIKKPKFTLKPKQVKKYLDEYVIRQDAAKKVLATTVCDHYRHLQQTLQGDVLENYAKPNVLMVGPTGVGKTYLIRCLAKCVGVPFVKADATKFSETGYVGGDVTDIVRDLVQEAGGDIKLAQRGMVFIDEIDKIASIQHANGLRDVSGSGVQRGLLKMMEESEIPLRNPQDVHSQIQTIVDFQKKGKVNRPVINTRHILFIVSGAFNGLSEIIARRHRSHSMGFHDGVTAAEKSQSLMDHMRTDDFVQYGFEPEFVGRLPVRVACSKLNAEDLYRILTDVKGALIRQIERAFRAYGIECRIEEGALRIIAQRALAEKTGARGLITVCEKVFRDLKFELPSTLLKRFTLTESALMDPDSWMTQLLGVNMKEKRLHCRNQMRIWEEHFFERHRIKVLLDDMLMDIFLEEGLTSLQSIGAYLDKRLNPVIHGLGLIDKKKPSQDFRITPDVLKDPHSALDLWIRDAYST